MAQRPLYKIADWMATTMIGVYLGVAPGKFNNNRLAYHAERDFPVVHTLVCDDAPQFKDLTQAVMLCWISLPDKINQEGG